MCLKFYCMWTRKNEASLKFVVVKFGNGETVRFNRLDWMSSSSIKSRHHCHVLKNTLDYILNLVFFLCDCLFSFFFVSTKTKRKKNFIQCLTFPHREHASKFQTKDIHTNIHIWTHTHTLSQYLHTQRSRDREWKQKNG